MEIPLIDNGDGTVTIPKSTAKELQAKGAHIRVSNRRIVHPRQFHPGTSGTSRPVQAHPVSIHNQKKPIAPAVSGVHKTIADYQTRKKEKIEAATRAKAEQKITESKMRSERVQAERDETVRTLHKQELKRQAMAGHKGSVTVKRVIPKERKMDQKDLSEARESVVTSR